MDFMGEYLAARKKAGDVFSLPLITKKHIKSLGGPEAEYLYKKIGDTYSGLEGDERAQFTRKIRPLLAGDSNKEIWEFNQSQITAAIKKLLCETSVMPTNSAIARETGLSRQTIITHVKAYNSHDFLTEMSRFKGKVPELLSKIYEAALNGNMEAARLYFQVSGVMPGTRRRLGE
ncbi:MAG: hypothetical protein V4577_09460 [Bacteroidota bacterium]